jgi:hypothetical protein
MEGGAAGHVSRTIDKYLIHSESNPNALPSCSLFLFAAISLVLQLILLGIASLIAFSIEYLEHSIH